MYKEESSRNMALHHLIEKYQQKLYWQIRKIVIDHDDADDVMRRTGSGFARRDEARHEPDASGDGESPFAPGKFFRTESCDEKREEERQGIFREIHCGVF